MQQIAYTILILLITVWPAFELGKAVEKHGWKYLFD